MSTDEVKLQTRYAPSLTHISLNEHRETSSNALAACIASFGGLIPNNVRSTLDSIIHTCLATLYSSRGGSVAIFAYPNVKRSMLQLGMNCACVPWGDGGRSTIANVVCTLSSMLRNDPDTSVASTALSTLCAIDAFMTPRAPPLLIPTRSSMIESSSSAANSGTSASAMLQGMNDSKLEMMASNEAKEERRAKKSQKKSNKKAKKDEKAPPEPNLKEQQTTNGDSKVVREKEVKKSPVLTSIQNGKSTPRVDSSPDEVGALETDTRTMDTLYEPNNSKDDKITMIAEPVSKKVEVEELQSDNSVAVDTAKSEEDMEMKEDDDNSDESMDDFPEIVDEEPDEEDRIV